MLNPVNLFILSVYFFSSFLSDKVYFQSDRLTERTFTEIDLNPVIQSDEGAPIQITGLKDETGLLYWYRRIETPVCRTGTCKLIDIGIFWNCSGDFFGLEVYSEPLTKTDHSEFQDEDYVKLIQILDDDWSILREYDFKDLTAGSEVDGVTGATSAELAGEAIEQAVYTTYTIWHLTHVGEKEQLIDLTANQINNNPDLLDKIIESGQIDYHYFLVDLLKDGKINPSPKMDDLLLRGLSSEDQGYKNYAFRSLIFSNKGSSVLQLKMAEIYDRSTLTEKLKILDAFKSVEISDAFYNVLVKDKNIENQWFQERLIEVLKNKRDGNNGLRTP